MLTTTSAALDGVSDAPTGSSADAAIVAIDGDGFEPPGGVRDRMPGKDKNFTVFGAAAGAAPSAWTVDPGSAADASSDDAAAAERSGLSDAAFEGDGFDDLLSRAHGVGLAVAASPAPSAGFGARRDDLRDADAASEAAFSRDDQVVQFQAAPFFLPPPRGERPGSHESGARLDDAGVGGPGQPDAPIAGELDVVPPAAVELAELDGATGFRVEGVQASSAFGRRVSGAGDVNGDGFADFVIGAPSADGAFVDGGEAFLVFGKPTPFGVVLQASDLDGTNGFRLPGAGAFHEAGSSVGAAGDVNGDGFGDFVIGGFGGYYQTGESYVVFGSGAGFPATLPLGSLDGTNGFRITGLASFDRAGLNIDGIGDFNGDGFDDLLIGADGAYDGLGQLKGDLKYGRLQDGESYVVFGTDAGFAASFDLSLLDGTNGFRIFGAGDNAYSGYAVSGAGDINGDGFDDLLIGTDVYTRKTFVLFGKPGPIGAAVDLSALSPADGFVVQNGGIGQSLSEAGDVNGDGLADFVLGGDSRGADVQETNSAFVVFGRTGGFGAVLDLALLDGSNGFRVDGLYSGSILGASVSGAGDINGDGFDDLILGAPGDSYGAGQSIVLFGAASGFSAVFDGAEIDGANGFLINDADSGDYSGESVSAVGDIDGDGYDDLLVGAPYGFGVGGQTGESYIIFGADTGPVTQEGGIGADVQTGAAGVDILIGAQGDDVLIGGGGLDVLRGGQGDDTLDVADLGYQRVVGGTGFDTLRLSGLGLDLDFTAVGDQQVRDIEAIDLLGGSATVRVDALSVRGLSQTSNRLEIVGDATSTLDLADSGWITTFQDAATVVLRNGSAEIAVSRPVAVIAADLTPIAQPDDFQISEDSGLSGNVLLDNGAGPDADPDGDVLFVDAAPVQNVQNGLLTLNNDGTFVYTPNADFFGTDTFVYAVDDGKGGIATATVTIVVSPIQDAPTAVLDNFTTFADVVLTGNVLDDNGNGPDFDVDLFDVLTVDTSPIIDVQNGALTLNGDGTFVYTPNPGFSGTDSFVYLLFDDKEGASTATVSIAVLGENNPPTARPDALAVLQGERLSANLLQNNGSGPDFDSDGDPLSIDVGLQPELAHGVVRLKANGDVEFFADEDFFGVQSFEYRLLDARGGEAVGTAFIDVQEDFSRILFGGSGGETFVGDGRKQLRYDFASSPVLADLGSGLIGAGGERDSVSNIFDFRGSAFDDVIFGSAAVPGGPQQHHLLGGFESFEGLAGDDVLFGGKGLDQASYIQSPGGVVVNLETGIASDGFGGQDSLFAIEGIKGSNGADVLVGDQGDNFFQPMRGADVVDGRGGIDLLLYDGVAANLDIDLSSGVVRFEDGDVATVRNIEDVETGVGADRIVGTGGANRLAGGDGDDFIVGRSGDDRLFGEAGDDRLFGNSSQDFLDGGFGDDRLSGADGADELLGQQGDDVLVGGRNADRLVGFGQADKLIGEGGRDALFGNGGDDRLFGGSGLDSLSGGGGNDRLDGGKDADALMGGGGADIFTFLPDSGVDTILDFEIGLDRINVIPLGISSFSEIQAILADVGGRAQIAFDGPDDIVRLNGVQSADLSAGDFLFA